MLLAGGTMPLALPLQMATHLAADSDIKLGLIGCGSRGTAVAIKVLQAHQQTSKPAVGAACPRVRLVAVADVFEDRIQQAMRAIRSHCRDQVAPQCQRFSGLDAYQNLLELDVDLVILAAPPGFRPLHFAAAVDAGKHVFVENPIAVDAPGVRSFSAANLIAIERNLAVMVGLPRRQESICRQTVQRLKEGAIGNIYFCRAYWNQNATWPRPRTRNQSELEYQLRNWQFFNWLSGDCIVAQHVQNLDVINGLLAAHPEKAQGVGGRQIRGGHDYGQNYDHHTVEFSYSNGVRLLSMCRQMSHCWNAVGEFAHGSEGWADINGGQIFDLNNQLVWSADTSSPGSGAGSPGSEVGLADWLTIARDRVPFNIGQEAAESTMTAIMGRMATYSGKELTWKQCCRSTLALADTAALRSLADPAPILPQADGRYEVVQPGDGLEKVL